MYQPEITKLPDNLDPLNVIKYKVNEIYRICPFCKNETAGPYCSDFIYKKYRKNRFKFWDYKIIRYKKYSYCCNKCGSEWNSIAFPDESIFDKKDMNKIWKQITSSGEDFNIEKFVGIDLSVNEPSIQSLNF